MITQVAKRNTGLGNNAEHAQSISDKALDSYTLHGSQAARKRVFDSWPWQPHFDGVDMQERRT